MKAFLQESNNRAMGLPGRAKRELPQIGFKKRKSLLHALPGTSLASVEALSLPLVQEIVLSADVQCAECQKRLQHIMSRMGETESVVVNLLEKKVTLTCRYRSVADVPSKQLAAIYKNPLGKVSMFKWMFGSSSS